MDYLRLIFGALLIVGSVVDFLIFIEKDMLSEKEFSISKLGYDLKLFIILIVSFSIGVTVMYKELA